LDGGGETGQGQEKLKKGDTIKTAPDGTQYIRHADGSVSPLG
jgi:hypothetical protein